VNEAAIVAVGLATAEVFSSMDEVVPEGIHEATPEAGNDSVESGTAHHNGNMKSMLLHLRQRILSHISTRAS
jgi:hypothetical protein